MEVTSEVCSCGRPAGWVTVETVRQTIVARPRCAACALADAIAFEHTTADGIIVALEASQARGA